MPTQELSGTTALVAGASRGFGRAIAIALSKHGAHVAGVARDPRQGVDIPTFLDRLGPALTPEQAGTAIVDIATGAADDRDAYLLTATGLSPAR